MYLLRSHQPLHSLPALHEVKINRSVAVTLQSTKSLEFDALRQSTSSTLR